MKARPIIFRPDMIRAIINGRKTQTRRVVKQTADYGPEVLGEIRPFGDGTYYTCAQDGTRMSDQFPCRYGQPGDLLWIRETWSHLGEGVWTTKNARWAGESGVIYKADRKEWFGPQWWPSIFMPREFSRLSLQVNKVRVQRVQETSAEDARAEAPPESDKNGVPYCDPLIAFTCLWDRLNFKRGYGWADNPWVWVIEFEPIFKNVDEVLRGSQ